MATDHSTLPLAPVTDPGRPTKTPALKIWAGIGVAFVALHTYILTKWVTGPNFEPVAQGQSDPPTWMRIELIAWQVVSIPAALLALYWFVIRPWRRERTVGIDGLFVIAGFSIFCQDVWSSAGGHWFTYNASMVNRGSWANDVPWFNAYGQPGQQLVEPVLFLPAAYTWIMFIAAGFGCWAMKRLAARRPQSSTFQIVSFGFVVMFLFDVVLEGLIWLPMGIFSYAGGHWSLFPETYHKFPLHEGLTIGAVFTAMAVLKYYRDDRGLTIVERGAESMDLRSNRTLWLRIFAVVGFVNTAMFLLYNVPNTLLAINGTEWPKDVQERSYFLNGICGEGTDRACPGGVNPHITEGSVYPNVNGGVTIPDYATKIPLPVPLDRGAPGGSQ
jgi:hypothetical protein